MIGRIGRGAGLFAASMAASQIGGTWGNVATGALMGAAAGTSILPGWGTAIGAALGGIPPIIHDIADSADKAKAATEKLKEEASKTASTIFGSEAEIRSLRGGAAVTTAMITAAAPLAAGRIAAIDNPERRAAAIVNEAWAARRTLETLTRLSTPEGLAEARSPRRLDPSIPHTGAERSAMEERNARAGALVAPTASELATARREAFVLAEAAAHGLDRPGIAGGGSGGAGFISDTLTSAVLSSGPEDPSVDLLTEIGNLLTSGGTLGTIAERLRHDPA